jgi:glutamine amidotransferase
MRDSFKAKKICIIDSGICNLDSVIRSFDRLKVPLFVTEKPGDLPNACGIVLPGVGAFANAMESLRQRGLDLAIREVASQNIPILGICLGMQLMVEESEEYGNHTGLGLIPGRAIRLHPCLEEERVPNIGWCDVNPKKRTTLFPKQIEPQSFYFAHSYYLDLQPEYIAASINFGGSEVPVALVKDNIFGVQFHPEKSQDVGLDLLNRWTANFMGLKKLS